MEKVQVMKIVNDTTSEVGRVLKYLFLALLMLGLFISVGIAGHMFGSYIMAMVIEMTTTKSPDDVQNTANGIGIAIGILSMLASIIAVLTASGAFEEG